MAKKMVIDCTDPRNVTTRLVDALPGDGVIPQETLRYRKKMAIDNEVAAFQRSPEVRAAELKVLAGTATAEHTALIMRAAEEMPARAQELKDAVDNGEDVRPVRGSVGGNGSWPS